MFGECGARLTHFSVRFILSNTAWVPRSFDSRVGFFTSINPLIIHIDGFHEIIDVALIGLAANCTSDGPCVPFSIQFYFAGPFVVTKRTIEHGGQGLDILLLRWGLSLTLFFPHNESLQKKLLITYYGYEQQTETRITEKLTSEAC